MTQLGADPDDLWGLARSLRDAAGRLDSLSSGLARRTRSVHWRGADADAARRTVTTDHLPAIAACSSRMASLSRQVGRHAEEQHRASHAGADPIPLLVPAPPTERAVRPPSSALRLGAVVPHEDRLRGTIEARVGPVTAAVAGELVVQHLASGRRRVVLTESGGVGGTVSVGSRVDVAVGGPHGAQSTGTGASADATARVGAIGRRSWEVDADRVDDLLARVALERAARSATGVGDPQVLVASWADRLVEAVTGHDPGADVATALATGVPRPDSIEQLWEVELAAGAAAGTPGAVGLGGRGQALLQARVGSTIRSDGGSAAVLELNGAATGALSSTLLRRIGISLPTDVHRALSVRVDIPRPLDGSPPSQLLVRTSATSDTQVQEVSALVEVDAGGAAHRGDLAAAARQLTDGDATAAIAALEALRFVPSQVQLQTSTGTLTGHSARAAASSGVGVGGGVTLRGQALGLDRR